VNKYTALGLLAAAAEGKRILVVSPHGHAVRDAVAEVHQLVPELKWRRANGDARVTLPSGGAIAFATPGQLRSRAADVVLVEDDRDISAELLHELRAVIATSKHGEIVRQ
jgi:tRNA(Met) C34 N-acetyltransferase TmcA